MVNGKIHLVQLFMSLPYTSLNCFSVTSNDEDLPSKIMYRKVLGGPPICMEGEKAARRRIGETLHWVGHPSTTWSDYPNFCSQMGGIPGSPKTKAIFSVYNKMLLERGIR